MRFSTTWTDINLRLNEFLDDTGLNQSGAATTLEYSASQRIAAWNWAQRLLVSHTPRQVNSVLTIDSDGRSAELPDDFFDVYRVLHLEDERYLFPAKPPIPGARRSADSELDYYQIWGRRLIFERDITKGDIELYYWAYWPEIEYRVENDDVTVVTEEIAVPAWTILPLCHLTAATCLQPGAIQAARTRQWNIEVDSGNPVQNSRASQAQEHLWWWNALISKMTPVMRSTP